MKIVKKRIVRLLLVFLVLLLVLLFLKRCEGETINEVLTSNENYEEQEADSSATVSIANDSVRISRPLVFEVAVPEVTEREDSIDNPQPTQPDQDLPGILSDPIELNQKNAKTLGFDIRNHVVFYRNRHPDANYFFSTINWRDGLYYNSDSIDIGRRKSLVGTYHLQKDTFPDNTIFYSQQYRWGYSSEKKADSLFIFQPVYLSYYPVAVTDIFGKVVSLQCDADFSQIRDRLLPVIIRFSRLHTEVEADLIFWFEPDTDFLEAITSDPHIYNSELIGHISDYQEVDDLTRPVFNLKLWREKQLLNPDTIIDGSPYVSRLTEEELEVLGIRFQRNRIPVFNYVTAIGKSSNGISNPYYSSFYCKYVSDTLGNLLYPAMTNSKIFQIANDVLLPAKYEEYIFWFNLSDRFWRLLPERYHVHKPHYDIVQFNKSLYPDKNYVRF